MRATGAEWHGGSGTPGPEGGWRVGAVSATGARWEGSGGTASLSWELLREGQESWALLCSAWEKEIVLVLHGYRCADVPKLPARVWLRAQPALGTASAESLLLWQFKLHSTFSSGSPKSSI